MKNMVFRRNRIFQRNTSSRPQTIPLFPHQTHRNIPEAVLQHKRNHLMFSMLTRFVLEAMKIQQRQEETSQVLHSRKRDGKQQ